ncbi:granulocyte colony-stimulating factor receptor, partial [Clarias magur]
ILSIMPQHWTTVHAVLWAILYSFIENVRGSPCAEVNSSSTMVPFGSAVTASCFINEECSLTKNHNFHIKWNKNAHFFTSSKGIQKNVYEIFISNFNDTKAVLECFICSDDNCQVVGAVEIKAVYPPSIPKNLTCRLHLNKSNTLECRWDPDKKPSDVPTNYTLYTEFSDPPNSIQKCTFPSPEENIYWVPRGGFILFSEMQVYVVATNVLGQAKSAILVLDPMKTATLDAPLIQGVGTQTFGCLEYKWSLAHTQKWIKRPINIEIKYKPMNNKIFNKEQFIRKPDNKVRLCGLLHGMSYKSQMRVRYHNSSSWSEWSNALVATTPMKAPTGQLVTWLKLQRAEGKNQTAQLFWKHSLQFRPNSMNVSYIVCQTKEPRKKNDILCITAQQHCSFQISAKFKKLYLIAMNEAGKSHPTEVPVYRQGGMHHVPLVTIVPKSEDSLLVKWKILDTSAISASVLEWKALCGENLCHVSFEIVDRNQTSFVVSGLKPYMPYEVSVYPGGIDPPNSTIAYTKEKAPSRSPNLKIGQIRPSSVALSWNEIPLKERNGIITGYSIYYGDQKSNPSVINTEGTKRDLVLKDLYPGTNYEIFLITSTHGGVITGSNVTVTTASFDAFEIVLIVIPACVGLILFFLGLFTCFVKQKWMKKYVWPVIPDPANSNIKKWTTADSVECMPRFKEVKDPALVYLSHVSLLSLPEKELPKEDENVKSSNWPHNGKIVDAGHDDSSCNSEGFDSEQQNESVPYATVVFAGPYQRQPVPPPVYLRSESTQPLLGEEEPSSPRPYERITTQPSLPDVDHFSPFHKNSERLRLKEEQLIAKVQRHENDRNSTEVKVAMLTARIRNFQEHLQKHPKDKANKRWMLMSIDRRKKLLKYLRRSRYDAFENVCAELGITYTFPPEYYRRATRRWLAKKALCIKRQQFINMSNPVITQPGAASYGTNVQTGEWSTGLCSCCSDLLVCGLGCICPIALSCYTANKYGENPCLACVPGGMAAMRTHMRLTYGIQGTICNDALMTCCCGIFETCRMTREIRIRNGE